MTVYRESYLSEWYRPSPVLAQMLENERHRIDTEIARFFDGYPWNFGCPNREPEPPPLPPVPIDEEASYEQWIGLLYACAVFRGVVEHPPPWLAESKSIAYVASVDPAP